MSHALELLYAAALAALVAKALLEAIQPGMLLGFWLEVLLWLHEKGWGFWAKPLGLCDMCATFWVGVGLGLYLGLAWDAPLVGLGAAALSLLWPPGKKM